MPKECRWRLSPRKHHNAGTRGPWLDLVRANLSPTHASPTRARQSLGGGSSASPPLRRCHRRLPAQSPPLPPSRARDPTGIRRPWASAGAKHADLPPPPPPCPNPRRRRGNRSPPRLRRMTPRCWVRWSSSPPPPAIGTTQPPAHGRFVAGAWQPRRSGGLLGGGCWV